MMTLPSSNPSYLAGVELAQAMFDMGEQATKPDNELWWTLDEEGREGHPHDNWALTFVEKVLAHPELAEGFAAALSDLVPCAYV